MVAEPKKSYGTALTKVNDVFVPLIERQLSGNGINMDNYAKQCVISALSAIHTALDAKGISWDDEQLDRNNVTQSLLAVASLKLNAAAHPREVYFQVRNTKIKVNGKDVWKKQIEMGIEGDGNDSILARFGRDVKKVGQFWLVRENDHFEYPKYTGLAYEPPKWTPTGKGPVVRVVYPLIKKDDTIEFYIGERDDSAKNLMAHISNNMMNETFGVCADRWNADAQQKKEIAARKAAVLKRAHDLGLAALDDPELQAWISPAWTEYHSRESMIIRKMRNNIVKRIPKDFGNAFVEMTYSDTTDETETAVKRLAEANANGEVIDVEGTIVPETPADGAKGSPTSAPEPTQTAAAAQQEKPAPPPAAQTATAREPETAGAGPTQQTKKGPGF